MNLSASGIRSSYRGKQYRVEEEGERGMGERGRGKSGEYGREERSERGDERMEELIKREEKYGM